MNDAQSIVSNLFQIKTRHDYSCIYGPKSRIIGEEYKTTFVFV